jgi:hypothetical protein
MTEPGVMIYLFAVGNRASTRLISSDAISIASRKAWRRTPFQRGELAAQKHPRHQVDQFLPRFVIRATILSSSLYLRLEFSLVSSSPFIYYLAEYKSRIMISGTTSKQLHD